MGASVSGVGVVDKAVVILRSLESGPRSLHGLTEATGLPRATTHRLATALEAHLLIERDSSGGRPGSDPIARSSTRPTAPSGYCAT